MLAYDFSLLWHIALMFYPELSTIYQFDLLESGDVTAESNSWNPRDTAFSPQNPGAHWKSEARRKAQCGTSKGRCSCSDLISTGAGRLGAPDEDITRALNSKRNVLSYIPQLDPHPLFPSSIYISNCCSLCIPRFPPKAATAAHYYDAAAACLNSMFFHRCSEHDENYECLITFT